MFIGMFSPAKPISAAQGRFGELIVAQGGGLRPRRILGGVGMSTEAGIDAPATPPAITVDSTKRYYIARTDIHKPGAVYNSPPEVSFTTSTPLPTGRARAAKAKAYLSQAGVSEIRMDDGGKHYPEPPTVTLSDSHGKGAVITAVLDAPINDGGECEDLFTGITQWSVVEQPDPESFASNPAAVPRFPVGSAVTLTITGDGTFDVRTGGENGVGRFFITSASSGLPQNCGGSSPESQGWTPLMTYTVSGSSGGTCASLTLTFTGSSFVSACSGNGYGYSKFMGSTAVESVRVRDRGRGYKDDSPVRIVINSVYGEGGRIVIEGYTSGSPSNTESPGYRVKSLKIDNPGSGYVVAPLLQIVSDSGFGAYGTCTVKDGKIDAVTLENGGGGYKTPPTVKILSGGAEAFAVARPHLRGVYQCYCRYVDDTPEDRGGPIPSNLSPVTEVDCGEGAASLTWSAPGPPGRATICELWRTTGNQALTLYRVHVGSSLFVDDLTDDELRDEDRQHYAAMPIVLPNGEVNAMRFTPPPSDKAVVVRFQDRFWYGVDTSGTEPNTVMFSEVDEPESVPDSNEFVLQQNARDADAISALIPYGPTMLVMQKRHAYSLTFSRQPLLDAQVSQIAYRGCLNQRCWEIHDGVCYVMDQQGIYSISPAGSTEPLSDAVQDIFRTQVDFASSEWQFLSVDPACNTLRAFVSLKGDNAGGYPSVAICYSLLNKAWWIERYPQRITAGTCALMSNGDFRCVYGGQGGAYLLSEGDTDAARGAITSVTITNRGSGYSTPPAVTAPGGTGASFRASINAEGQVSAIWIENAGYGYESGSLVIAPPTNPNAASPSTASASFSASSMQRDTGAFVQYSYKTGNAAFPTDADNARAGGESSRSVAVTYDPQPEPCEASIRMYYNNSPHPRKNVAQRNRGTGVVHSTVDNAVRLDFGQKLGVSVEDSGVRTALFAGRSIDDMGGADRHVAVEIVGAATAGTPVVIHDLNVYGTGGK